MKKSIIALIMVLAVSMSMAAVDAFSRGWNSDPASDPAFSKFLEETADIRKEIAIDRAELDALMAGQNPDATRVRELSGSIADNQEKLSEIARANDLGAQTPGASGGCGGRRTADGYCGSCGGGSNAFGGRPGPGGGNGSCGSPGCPGAGPGR